MSVRTTPSAVAAGNARPAQTLAGRAALARLQDRRDELVSAVARAKADLTRWTGEADPEHVVYRQRYGFGRAVEVDTALGAVLGASDGELDTATLITAVADILDADAEALADELLPRLRELIRQGYLSREGGPAT